MTMDIVTINIPDKYLKSMEILVEKGLYSNRSAITREALRSFLENEISFMEKDLANFDEIMENLIQDNEKNK